MAKKKEITNQDILGFYIDYFLENNKAKTAKKSYKYSFTLRKHN